MKQSNKVLIAGPWVGEFGWELFAWHAYVRALSKKYEKTVCISSPFSKFMYEDFCDKFINFSPNRGTHKDSFYKVGFSLSQEEIKDIFAKSEVNTQTDKISLFKPRRIGDPPRTHYTESFKFGEHMITPEYVKFGVPAEKYNKTIVFHARNRPLRIEDNWPIDNWKILSSKLASHGYDIVSIGLKSESMHVENTRDMRECDQKDLVNLLASAQCIFGPSSGAMHLASLCNCPQVVWTTNYNFTRYTENWNPHGSEILFLSEYGWQPSAEYVYEKYLKWDKNVI